MKKIIALAVAAAFVAPAAMAEVVVYGSLRTAVEYSKIDATTDANDVSRFRLIDESSRLGFKGSDKLDNGLTVLWQAEQRVRVGSSELNGTNNATSGWGDRDTFVGLQGDFGLIRAGKFDDIIDASKGDFFVGIDNMDETSGGTTKFVRRGSGKPTNVVAYHSPSFSGFAFKAQYDFGSDTGTTNTNGYAATAFYKHKFFDFGAGYKQVNDIIATTGNNSSDAAVDDKFKYFVVGANIKPVDGLNIGLVWDRTEKKDASAGTTVKQDGYGIGATYATGKYKFGLAGGMLDDTKGAANNDETSSWGVNLGMQYNLSKQTKLLAGATYVHNDDRSSTGSGTVASVGASGANTTAITGTKITAVSVGIRTDF